MKYKYQMLFDWACDKCYYIETTDYIVYRGVLLNYCNGNIVLLSTKGIVHLPYSEVHRMYPLSKIPFELEEVLKSAELKEIKKEKENKV